jgi:Cell Wall Hydrolase
MDPITLLAGIIQGEASQPADQFGVASVIQNRLNAGFPGASGGALGIATAQSQFSAYPNALGTPTPNAIALATALQNGTLSQYGNTGNALYYNAPGFAYTNNGTNAYSATSNVYSDLFKKQPSSNFRLPQLGGSSIGAGDATNAATGQYINSGGLGSEYASAQTHSQDSGTTIPWAGRPSEPPRFHRGPHKWKRTSAVPSV